MHFEESVIQEPLVELSEEGYGHAHPLCENHFEALDDQTAKREASLLTLGQSAGRITNEFFRVDVDGHFCADRCEALETFRAQTVVHFEGFPAQKTLRRIG